MDISALNPRRIADESPTRVHLRHPSSGAPLLDESGEPLVIYAWHKESSQWRNAALQNGRARAESGVRMTAEDVENDLISVLAQVTTSISSNIEVNGEAPKSALALYQSQHWIAEQVLTELSKRSTLFFKPASA